MNPKITQIELANQLNLSRSTIKRMLNRLQQQEIVIRKGSNRRVTNFNWGHYFWGLIWGQF